jgi:SRSO17 transposase
MDAIERFDRYLAHLAEGLGHSDRHSGLRGYCTGLMLPLARKSVEPAADAARRARASVPEAVEFATKTAA